MREKLVKLLDEVHKKPLGKEYMERLGTIADHLIANGVTFATDNNVSDKMDFCGELRNFAEGLIKKAKEPKWIPVTKRLPKYFDNVLINVPGDKPFVTVHEAHLRKDGLWDTGLYRYDWDDVTHWMPLPEPPKGE